MPIYRSPQGLAGQPAFTDTYLTKTDASGTYAPRREWYNRKVTSFQRTRFKLGAARAGVGEAKIATIGHSIVAGTGGTVGSTDWPTQLASMLVSAGYPLTGSGIVPACRGSVLGTPADSRWNFPAGWGVGIFGTTLAANGTNSNPAVFTSTNTGTIVNVYYHSGGSALSNAFTVTIDGGDPVTVNLPGGSALGKYTVTELPDTTHAVSIARQNGTQFIAGVEIRSSNTGVTLINAGIAGAKAADLVTNGTYYYTPVLVGGASNYNADCVLIMIEANDAFAATNVATWTASVQLMIDRARSNGTAEIGIVADNPISGLDMSAYNAALHTLADSNDLPVLNLQERWGSYAAANAAGAMSDGTHPNGAGYGDMARAVMDFIGL